MALAAPRPLRALLGLALVAVGSTALLAAVIAGLLRFRYPRHPRPLGGPGVRLGSLRVRLPALQAAGDSTPGPPGPMVQITYPAAPRSSARAGAAVNLPPRESYFRPELTDAVSEMSPFPHWFTDLVTRRRQVDAPQLPREAQGTGLPIVVFSSGLYGSLEIYTQLGREVASEGAIFVAVEHEDGSALYAVNASSGKRIQYRRPPADYNFSAGRPALIEWRRPFLEKRTKELRHVVNCLKEVVGGGGDREAPPHTSTVTEPAVTLLQEVLSSADMDRLVFVGHSLGAAGVIMALQSTFKEKNVGAIARGAILYDPWLSPVPDVAIEKGLTTPYVVLLSEEWYTYKNELKLIEMLRNGNAEAALASVVFNGTRHQWISDAHLWLPRWLVRRLGLLGPGDYKRVRAATVGSTTTCLKELLKNDFGGASRGAEASRSLARRLSSLAPNTMFAAFGRPAMR